MDFIEGREDIMEKYIIPMMETFELEQKEDIVTTSTIYIDENDHLEDWFRD